jgi:hypothetical protein
LGDFFTSSSGHPGCGHVLESGTKAKGNYYFYSIQDFLAFLVHFFFASPRRLSCGIFYLLVLKSLFFVKKLTPGTLAGFELTTNFFPSGDDTTRQRHQNSTQINHWSQI